MNFSDIYCTGPVLHQVQEAKLFDDDKHFVDMKLRERPGKLTSASDLLFTTSSLWLLFLLVPLSCRCRFVGFSQPFTGIAERDRPAWQAAGVPQDTL